MSSSFDRAVDAQIDSYRPAFVPPFEVVEARRRSRRRRRLAVAGAALPVAVLALAVVAVPLLDGGAGDRLTPPDEGPTLVYAAQTGRDPQTGEPVRRYTLPSPAERPDGTSRCLGLDGVSTTTLRSEPPQYVAVAAGQAPIDAFEQCVAGVPGLSIPELRAEADREAPDVIAWTGAEICSFDPARSCRRLESDAARALARTLAVDSRRPVGADGDCSEDQADFTIVFQHPSVRAAVITVPELCGPMRVGSLAYDLDPATRTAVAAAYAAAAPDPQPSAR